MEGPFHIKMALLLQQSARTRQTRHHCPDGNARNLRDFPVGHVLHLSQYKNFAKILGQGREYLVEIAATLHLDDGGLRIRLTGDQSAIGDGNFMIGRDRHVELVLRSTRGRQEAVAHDRHQPGLYVVAANGIERTVGTQHRVLNDVVGIQRWTREPSGKIVRRIEMRDRLRLKSAAPVAHLSCPRRFARPFFDCCMMHDLGRSRFIPAGPIMSTSPKGGERKVDVTVAASSRGRGGRHDSNLRPSRYKRQGSNQKTKENLTSSFNRVEYRL